MKKIVMSLIIALFLFMPFVVSADETDAPETTAAKEKVNVYLFRGEGCPHCEEAIEWFDNTLSKDDEYSSKYNLVSYEVWYDETNSALMEKVAESLETSANGVPFIVIGDRYFSGFSASSSPDQIKDAINAAYDNADYQDVVSSVQNGKEITKEDESSNQILPIVIVSAIAIITVLALVFFTKEKE